MGILTQCVRFSPLLCILSVIRYNKQHSSLIESVVPLRIGWFLGFSQYAHPPFPSLLPSYVGTFPGTLANWLGGEAFNKEAELKMERVLKLACSGVICRCTTPRLMCKGSRLDGSRLLHASSPAPLRVRNRKMSVWTCLAGDVFTLTV